MVRHCWRVSLGAVLGCLSLLVAYFFHRTLTAPYMDEIFHIPQAQRFCSGDYTWDPKITTLPGLYLFSTFFSHLHTFLHPSISNSSSPICSIPSLRLLNIIFLVLTYFVLCALIRLPAGPEAPRFSAIKALRLSLYPLHFFFGFLFYTDTGSTFWILLGLLCAKKHRFLLSSVCCAIAVLFRQTNIIWTFFIVGEHLISSFERQRHGVVGFVLKGIWKLTQRVGWFVFVGVGFVVFLRWNEWRIVVGDKQNHEVGFHGAQLGYFCVWWTCVGSFGAVVEGLLFWPERFGRGLGGWRGIAVLYLIVVLGAIGTKVHMFILGDNRHYGFYLWRAVLGFGGAEGSDVEGIASMRNVLYSPIYFAAFIVFWTLESISQGSVLKQGLFLICLAAVLMPAQLIEFRYFTIPFFLSSVFSLPKNEHDARGLGYLSEYVTLILYVVIDAVSLYVFLAKPFGESRFMW